MKQANEKFELIAHININPNDFRDDEYCSQYELPPDDIRKFWKESLKNADFPFVKTFHPHEWSVDVRDIQDEALLKYLVDTFPYQSELFLNQTDFLRVIDAGLSLVHGSDIVLSAQCCTDLTDIDNWETAAAYRGSDWIQLWNGHPWNYVKFEDGDYVITDFTETEPPDSLDVLYIIPEPLLTKTVQQAKEAIIQFTKRFATCWNTYSKYDEKIDL